MWGTFICWFYSWACWTAFLSFISLSFFITTILISLSFTSVFEFGFWSFPFLSELLCYLGYSWCLMDCFSDWAFEVVNFFRHCLVLNNWPGWLSLLFSSRWCYNASFCFTCSTAASGICVGFAQGKCPLFPKEVSIPCQAHLSVGVPSCGRWQVTGLQNCEFPTLSPCNQKLLAMLCYPRCLCWVPPWWVGRGMSSQVCSFAFLLTVVAASLLLHTTVSHHSLVWPQLEPTPQECCFCPSTLWAAVWGVQHDFFPTTVSAGAAAGKGKQLCLLISNGGQASGCHTSATSPPVTRCSCNRPWPLWASGLLWVGCTPTPSLVSHQPVCPPPPSPSFSCPAYPARTDPPTFTCLNAQISDVFVEQGILFELVVQLVTSRGETKDCPCSAMMLTSLLFFSLQMSSCSSTICLSSIDLTFEPVKNQLHIFVCISRLYCPIDPCPSIDATVILLHTGTPRFIVLHRGCMAYRWKAKPSTSKKITACFITMVWNQNHNVSEVCL